MNIKTFEIAEKIYAHKIDPNEAESLLLDLFDCYKNELLDRLDSMVVTSKKMFTDEAFKTTEMVIDNVKHHVIEIAKKHYH